MKILYVANERRAALLAADALREIAPDWRVAWAGQLSEALHWVHYNPDLAALVVEAEVQNQSCTSLVGEVRGPKAFDLLQAMNTGHDGSMGTLHANNPREALSRCESMITMGGFSLPSRTIREMICASVDVVVQAARLRDGSRKITHITEVMGTEGDVIVTQDIFLYDMEGEDAKGNITGRHRSTGIGHPRFWDRARYYGEEKRLAAALDAADAANEAMRA